MTSLKGYNTPLCLTQYGVHWAQYQTVQSVQHTCTNLVATHLTSMGKYYAYLLNPTKQPWTSSIQADKGKQPPIVLLVKKNITQNTSQTSDTWGRQSNKTAPSMGRSLRTHCRCKPHPLDYIKGVGEPNQRQCGAIHIGYTQPLVTHP